MLVEEECFKFFFQTFQGYGAGTQISGSGSSSVHLKFWLRLWLWLRLQHLQVLFPSPEQFWSKKSEKTLLVFG